MLNKLYKAPNRILHSKELGQGEPLLLLHGFMGMGDNLKTVADGLAPHYRVFLLDARNHGSSPHSDVMNYDAMANDLLDFCKAKGIDSFSLLGHSMGGKIAMTFASKHPNMVRNVIVADIVPKKYKNRYSDDVRRLLELDLSKMTDRRDADLALQTNIPNKNIRSFFLKSLAYADDGKLYWTCNLPVLLRTLPETTNFPTIPDGNPHRCLFIYGMQSDYVREEDKPLILQKFPRAEFVGIEGAGHWLHAQKPQEFVEAVKGFLSKNPPCNGKL